MILSSENIEKIDFFYSLINKGRYASIDDIVNTYNTVFADRQGFRPRKYTSCSSCLKQMCCEMYFEKEKALIGIPKT